MQTNRYGEELREVIGVIADGAEIPLITREVAWTVRRKADAASAEATAPQEMIRNMPSALDAPQRGALDLCQ